MRIAGAFFTGIALIFLSAGVQARSLRNAGGPAEIPPASYKAMQYVDSRGCAYIRTGYGGKVTWVPRVTRSKQLVCGLKPTRVAGARPAAVTAAAPKRARAVIRQPAATPRITAVRTPSAATPRRVATSAAARQPAQTQRPFNWNAFWFGTPHKRPAPAPTIVSKPRPPGRAAVATAPIPARTTTAVAAVPCPCAVRTGPQAIHPAVAYRAAIGRQSLPVLRPRVQPPQVAPIATAMPKGYHSLLADPSILALRAVGTAEGKAAMDLIWTETVPRRLIDATTGRDVTERYPQIRYPYQTASLRPFVPAYASTTSAPRRATTTRSTRPRRHPVRDEAAPANMRRYRNINDTSARTTDVQGGIRGANNTGAGARPARAVYVQVATFGVPKNATRTLARFEAAGLPTIKRPVKRRGKRYDIVMLGPFKDAASLGAALQRARRAGFSDAFTIRN